MAVIEAAVVVARSIEDQVVLVRKSRQLPDEAGNVGFFVGLSQAADFSWRGLRSKFDQGQVQAQLFLHGLVDAPGPAVFFIDDHGSQAGRVDQLGQFSFGPVDWQIGQELFFSSDC